MKSEGARGETRLAKGYMIQSARDATGREKEAMAREMERAVEWAVVMFQGLHARVAHRMRATPASTAGSVDGCVGGDIPGSVGVGSFRQRIPKKQKIILEALDQQPRP
tara:strand:- start:369 stop:692 length:324 start_codon:yes stop_codon:yes gene_type:complete